MQKIFVIVEDRYPSDEDGNYHKVNEFIKDKGTVISVTAQEVAGDNGNRGRWLVVADDGKGLELR